MHSTLETHLYKVNEHYKKILNIVGLHYDTGSIIIELKFNHDTHKFFAYCNILERLIEYNNTIMEYASGSDIKMMSIVDRNVELINAMYKDSNLFINKVTETEEFKNEFDHAFLNEKTIMGMNSYISNLIRNIMNKSLKSYPVRDIINS